jgi:hypothetical protein
MYIAQSPTLLACNNTRQCCGHRSAVSHMCVCVWFTPLSRQPRTGLLGPAELVTLQQLHTISRNKLLGSAELVTLQQISTKSTM